MENILYTIAATLIIVWAVGFIAYHADGMFHSLLVVAIIAIVLKMIIVKKPL